MLLIGASVSYGQQFNATVFDLDTGRIRIITGSVDKSDPELESYRKIIERTRAERLRLKESTDRIWAEMAAQRAQEQLEEQTRILRRIFEKE